MSCHFTYVTAHSDSPSFPSLHLHHSSFSNPSLALPTSQLILQPFRRFTYVTAQSPTLPLLYLRHSSFSNPSFASLTSQDLHLIHLASRPWFLHAPSNQCTSSLCSVVFPKIGNGREQCDPLFYCFFNWLFIVALTARSYRDCHCFFCLGMVLLLIY